MFSTNGSTSLSNHLKLTHVIHTIPIGLSLKAKNLSQLDREAIQAEHNSHTDESKKRYDMKAADSKIAKDNSSHKVLTGDL